MEGKTGAKVLMQTAADSRISCSWQAQLQNYLWEVKHVSRNKNVCKSLGPAVHSVLIS